MLRRIFLFLLTNLAIITVISIILSVFNIQPYLTRQGLDYESLLIYSVIVGFTGSFISLFMSKWMAKMAFRIQIIQQPSTSAESLIYSTVQTLAQRMDLGMPEVGIYESAEPNAFATGWSRNNALVAVSTGLLNAMNKDELEGVLGHEMTHVANGDMVTLTLIQGVVNTFVIFFARIAAYLVTAAMNRNNNDNRGTSQFAYYGISIIFQILFGILASMIVMWFSRIREFRADAGSAKYVGKQKMISALQRLDRAYQPDAQEDQRTQTFTAMKIAGAPGWMRAFASHPPIAERIAALEKLP